jgi:hypothetical protein
MGPVCLIVTQTLHEVFRCCKRVWYVLYLLWPALRVGLRGSAVKTVSSPFVPTNRKATLMIRTGRSAHSLSSVAA